MHAGRAALTCKSLCSRGVPAEPQVLTGAAVLQDDEIQRCMVSVRMREFISVHWSVSPGHDTACDDRETA